MLLIQQYNSMIKQQRKKKIFKQQKGQKKPVKKQFSEQQRPVHRVNQLGKKNQQLPTIQNMLQLTKERRQEGTIQMFKKVQPFLHSYIQKKQGSRVVQLMFKWGSQNIKQQIYKDVVKNWKQVIKSNYALHVVSKVSVQFEFARLAQDAIILQNHKEGSMVLQNFINKHPNSPKKSQIYQRFLQIYRQAEQKGFESQQILHNLAIKCVQKDYYKNRISKLVMKLALPTMIQNERQKIIQFFQQKYLQLMNDEEGVKLSILIYNYFNSKQKKNVVKQIKGRVAEILKMSSMSYVSLIKIITETDDTVTIGNKLLPEFLQLIDEVSSSNSKVYNVLISILSPRSNNFNCLGKVQKTVPFTTCKKSEQVRKRQIRQFVYQPLTEYLGNQQNIQNTCRNPNLSRLALGVIKSIKTDSTNDTLRQFTVKLIKYFLANLNQQRIGNTKKISIQKSLVADNFGSKLIKNILLIQQSFIDKYCDKFAELFRDNLSSILYSNASFVATVLIEKGRNELIDQIRRLKVDFSKVKASQFYQARLKSKITK